MLTDQDLQNELAAAFREQAGPAAAAAIGTAGIFRDAVRRRRHRQMAARATSVLAVVAAAVTVTSLTTWPAVSPVIQPPGLLLEADVTGPPPARAAVSGMPPYYVITNHNRPVAQVRDSSSGKALSVVRLPPGIAPKMSEITAAGNDHTFVLALYSSPQTRFYLLRVTSHGRSARLTPLSIPALPAGEVANDIAVSPDGGMLAVAVQLSGSQHGAVEAVSLATGAVRTWTTGRTGMPWALSWAKGGRELGFFWQDDAGSPQTTASGLWVLNTTAPGSNLMSGRRVMPEFTGGDDVQSAVLTPDGSTVIASVTYDGTGPRRPGHGGRGYRRAVRADRAPAAHAPCRARRELGGPAPPRLVHRDMRPGGGRRHGQSPAGEL